jgi:hypothetical protein
MLLNMVMFKVTICDLKNKDRNMADNIEYFYKLYAPLQANCPQLADDFKLLFLIPWDHHRRIIDKCKGNGATDNQRPFNAHLHAYVVYKKNYGMQAAVVLNLMHKGKDLLAFMK